MGRARRGGTIYGTEWRVEYEMDGENEMCGTSYTGQRERERDMAQEGERYEKMEEQGREAVKEEQGREGREEEMRDWSGKKI